MGIALSGDGGVDIAEDVVEFADYLRSIVAIILAVKYSSIAILAGILRPNLVMPEFDFHGG